MRIKTTKVIVEFHDNGAPATIHHTANKQVRLIQRIAMNGRVIHETAMRNDKKHGKETSWRDDGSLVHVTRYRNGLEHGISRQYGRSGEVIGKYQMVFGTGIDRWFNDNGTVAEERLVIAGDVYGPESWWNEDGTQVWREVNFRKSKLHGYVCEWREDGSIADGFPVFYLEDVRVSPRRYKAARRRDALLPPPPPVQIRKNKKR